LKTALVFGIVSFCFLLFFLYFLDLILFFRRERLRFESATDAKAYVSFLEEKQKKVKHPQKKNYYLYLLCLVWLKCDQKEKAFRLAPFLKKDSLLGVPDNFENRIHCGG